MIHQIDGHPYANLFPTMGDAEFEKLKQDILINGVRQPIVMYQGLILDGRHRFAACTDLLKTCPQVQFEGDDAAALAFVISTNLHRRHLDESQRAWVASKLANMRQGERTDKEPSANLQKVSVSDSARLLNVSERSVASAKAVRDHGVKELHEKVEKGEVAVSVASKIAKLPESTQREILKDERPEQAIKKVARAEKEKVLAEKTISVSLASEARLYGVVYADPPWRFETFSENGMDRSADNHYPTMDLEAIKALRIPAATDSVLYLWATAPMLPEALEVMRAWGFTYKSHAIWSKDRAGTGYWFRNKHELLLVGTRGNVPAPAPGTQLPSILESPLGRHSEKPALFAEMIEQLFPNTPKIELFCRAPRAGWAAYGNEAEAA